jgi:indolepyruvate ferredoxin oxidoreductase beta subunit
MAYEDAIRVAQLKTRPDRLPGIRRAARAPGATLVVTDYLKPDLDEIYGIMPHRVVAPFARWAERRWPHGRPTLGQRVRTTTVSGFLRLWLLARCRRLRPVSYRARQEGAAIERWLAAVRRCAGQDRELACEVARAGQLVKGYGDVRRRLGSCLDDLIGQVTRAAELEAALGGGLAASRALASRYRALVLQGPDSEARAATVAREVVARLEAGDAAGARAAAGG